MSRQYRVAIYMRLSKADDFSEEDESNSICMQRLLLREYVKKHFQECRLLEFCDDGYSGTNFNRPGITKLLELVKNSEVDCIAVKDFSRFSRDYIELGAYLDQIFPFMGIRFISVNDNYDSDTCMDGTAELDISFRSLLYDLYSKDLSVKVKASLAAKKEKGQYVSGSCPFGYEKAPGDRHMLLIEEDEAEIVRRIFSMTLEGMTSVQIARAFNEEKIKTPIEFKVEKGRTTRVPKGAAFTWTGPAICRILQNEIYVGDVVYGKYYKDGVGGKNHLKPREEWKVFHNHHEPVIDRETFEEVQRSRGKKKPEKSRERHPLTGKLVCGCCGRSLYFRSGVNPYFSCPNLYVNPQKDCIRKANAMFLEQYVLYEIQQRLQRAPDKEKMPAEGNKELAGQLRECRRIRRNAQAGLKSMKKKRAEVYERYVSERGDAAVKMPGEKCRSALQRLSNQEAELEKVLADTERKIEETEASLKKQNEMGLTGEAVQKMIDKIIVKDEQHMEIYWK